jgi:hypothetical protein
MYKMTERQWYYTSVRLVQCTSVASLLACRRKFTYMPKNLATSLMVGNLYIDLGVILGYFRNCIVRNPLENILGYSIFVFFTHFNNDHPVQ